MINKKFPSIWSKRQQAAIEIMLFSQKPTQKKASLECKCPSRAVPMWQKRRDSDHQHNCRPHHY